MKIKLLLVACFIAFAGVSVAQNAVTQDSVQTVDRNFENLKKTVIPSGRTVLADMKAHSPNMYLQYQAAKKKQRTGIILTGVGGGVIMIGALFSMIPDSDNTTITLGSYIFENGGDNSSLRTAGTVLMIGGATCLSVGLPVMISGGKKKKQTFQDFKNQYYLSPPPASYFQFNLSPNKVGVAYVF
jgi:hypothetical protein